MTKEEIREEFTKEVGRYLGNKLKEIEKITDYKERCKARLKHLDEFFMFNEMLNFTMNSLLEKHNYEFNNDEEFAAFNEFIKPTYDEMYKWFKVVGYEK